MLLAPPAGKASLPPSLVVGGPLSRSYQDITCLLSDFSSPRHIRSLSQGARCVELPDQPSPPTSPGMHPPGDQQHPHRTQKRSSLPPDLEEGAANESPVEDVPAPESHWHLRRVVSDKSTPSASASPTSPRRTVGDFVRRRLRSSTAPEQEPDSQGLLIPASLRPGLSTNQTYNSPRDAQPASFSHSPSSITTPDSAAPSTATDLRRLLPGSLTTYSPVAANPFDDAWQRGRRRAAARPEPASSSASTPAAPASSWETNSSMMIALPQPAGGFPSSLAPVAPHTAPLAQTPFLDTKLGSGPAAGEPEGLDSPSEFALFAAATSSFGFLPSTFDLAVSPVSPMDDSGAEPLPSSTRLPGKRAPRPPVLSLRTDFSPAAVAPRSRSQPPPASPSDHHLGLPAMPPRHGSHHAHRLSHAGLERQPQPIYQQHQYRRSYNPIPTGHHAVQPPPTQSTRNPRHSQSFPGPSSTATTTIAPQPSPNAPADAISQLSPQPRTLQPPKIDHDLDAFVTADHPPPDDEELPDYETSQAQASEARRDEAARRAADLEARWLRGRAERARGRPWRAWERGGGV